jgi:hypothetical protein
MPTCVNFSFHFLTLTYRKTKASEKKGGKEDVTDEKIETIGISKCIYREDTQQKKMVICQSISQRY